MLRIYCPDLLDGFEEAVANRTALVSEYRREFYEVLEDPHTDVADLGNMYHGMETTRRVLLAARADLRELIRKSGPVVAGTTARANWVRLIMGSAQGAQALCAGGWLAVFWKLFQPRRSPPAACPLCPLA
jgi:hypothetical protein